MSPRAYLIWKVQQASTDANVIAACDRLLEAERLGWNKHADRSDAQMVFALAYA